MFNLVWCLVLFFTFLQLMIYRLEFLASVKEVVGSVVILLEYEMGKCAGIHFNLVHDNKAFAGKTVGFIYKPLKMNELSRGAKRDAFP